MYFVHEALWISVLAPVGTVVGYTITLWVLRQTGRPLQPSMVRGVVFLGVVVATTVLGGWTVLGVALGLSFGAMPRDHHLGGDRRDRSGRDAFPLLVRRQSAVTKSISRSTDVIRGVSTSR